MTEYEQSVFISYAWGSERESVVNEIDESLQQRGIRIIRDKRALGYKGSIKEFMERIGRGSCIIVVISDKYLRSSNCMFELVEIAENKQFHDRVFPVVLNDANIYDPVKRIEYVKHWEAKRKELAKAMKGVDPANLHGIREEMDNYDRIRDRISGITSILKDMNTLTPDMHRDSEFSNLYDAIVERLKEGGTDVTAEFDELAQKAEFERKAKQEREAKAEADRLVVQKAKERLAQQEEDEERAAKTSADEERLAKLKAEEEQAAIAKAKAEADRKSKEELAAFAQPIETKAEPISVTSQKKSTSRGLLIGIAAIALVVFAIAGLGIRALLGGGSVTQAPPGAEINGQNVTHVRYPGGEFVQIDDLVWKEVDPKGNVFHYVETSRDEWSVCLRDQSRNFNTCLDLYTKKIHLDINDGNGQFDLYDIVSAE